MHRVVTAQDYFDTAVDLLVTAGPRSIKVSSLCAALEVTSGSFYGYFRGLDDFVEELLMTRLSDQNSRLLALTEGDAQPEMILPRLRELARAVPHGTEAAIRTLSRRHAAAKDLQHRLDQERVAAIAEILGPVVSTADDARYLAEIGMALLVGWQHLYPRSAHQNFDDMFDEFEATVRDRGQHVDPI